MKTIQFVRQRLCEIALCLLALPLAAAAFGQLAPSTAPWRFQGRYYPAPFTISIADYSDPNDLLNRSRAGWPSMLGAPNNLAGMPSVPSSDWTQVADNIGLSGLFGSRAYRMTGVADFNGDGIPDIISNSYSAANDPESQLEFYIGQPNGTFVHDTSNQALFSQIRAHGEQIVIADFNNDGALDVFLPCYTKPGSSPTYPNATHMSLLINDGSGHFIDATAIDEVDEQGVHHLVDEAGVGCAFDPTSPYATVTIDGIATGTPNRYLYWQPEGCQAVDLNQDGKLDLYLAARMFINQGNKTVTVNGKSWQIPTFVDKAAQYGLVDLDRTHLAPGQLFHTNTAAINLWASSHFYGTAFGPITYLNAFGPTFFDEGAQFVDWNNDGYLDLVLEAPGWGPALFEFNPSTQNFVYRPYGLKEGHTVPFFNSGPPNYGEIHPASGGFLIPSEGNDGINAYDIDNDGLVDLLTGGNDDPARHTNWSFKNMGYGFEWMHSFQSAADFGGGPARMFGPVNLGSGLGCMAYGDLNGDGLIDVVYNQGFGALAYINKTVTTNRSFVIEIVGPNGEKNQQGRSVTVTRLTPSARGPIGPNPIYTRVVDSGSGYQTQSQYPILMALPGVANDSVLDGYKVSVMFATKRVTMSYYPSRLPADSQNGLRIYAPSPQFPNGRTELYRLHPPAAIPDTRTDTAGLFRPGEYTFYLNNTNAQKFADAMVGFTPPPALPPFGSPANGVTALAGDWTGSGLTSIGLYFAALNTFYLRNSTTTGGADTTTVFQPELDDIPIAGDWTGKGFDTVGVYRKREHTFYLRNSHDMGEADIVVSPLAPDDHGNPAPPEDNDIPIAGDWDGDGITTIGLFRPRNQLFFLYAQNQSNSAWTTTYIADPNPTMGVHPQLLLDPDMHPIVGDWNGDGKSKIGLFARVFYLGTPIPGEAGMAAQLLDPGFAEDGDLPITGDWDNSGVTSIGLYRPGQALFILAPGSSIIAFRYGEVTNNDGASFLDFPFVAPILGGPAFVNSPIIGKWVAGGGSLVGVYQAHDRMFALRSDNSAGIADFFYTYAPNAPKNDIPIVGDWLGQGTTSLGVYRSSNRSFYLSNTNTNLNASVQASITDLSSPPNLLDGIPVVGDWDGNASTTIGLYDPNALAFYLRNANTTGPYDVKVDVSAFALPGDIPIAGNWSSSITGVPLTNGVMTLGLYRPSTAQWLLFYEPIAPNAARQFVPKLVFQFQYGAPGDVPVVGHWAPLALTPKSRALTP